MMCGAKNNAKRQDLMKEQKKNQSNSCKIDLGMYQCFRNSLNQKGKAIAN